MNNDKNQFSSRLRSVSLMLLFVLLAVPFCVFSQSDNADLVGMKLEDAEALLEKRGFEIAASSVLKKEQLWYNEKENNCLSIAFDKKEEHFITVVKPGDTGKCKSGVEASRKVWENYHDGQAPSGDAKVNEERKKLSDAGFKASYWINNVSPGRTAEYWVNETSKKVKSIVWDTQGGKWAMTNDTEYSLAKNPAPKKN
jgi:hypothetical protein